MNWRILTVGRPSLAYAREGCAEYIKRINRFAKLEHIGVRASDPSREAAGLMDRSEGCFRVVLDETGNQLTSRQLASKVDEWQEASRPVAVIIGGADGHAPELPGSAGLLWSLGSLTLQHELALVVVLEQIYRAHTILAGHPYHRD